MTGDDHRHTPPFDPIVSAALEHVQTPLWIYDVENSRVPWANRAARELLDAESVEELRERDMARGTSAQVAERFRQYQQDFEAKDQHFHEAWTLYPRGRPVSIDVQLSGWRMADGRMGIFCEAPQRIVETPETLRSAQALLYTPTLIWLFAEDGTALYANTAARRVQPDAFQRLGDLFAEPEHDLRLRQAVRDGRPHSVVTLARLSHGLRWLDIIANDCPDAVSGRRALLVSAVDVTELKEAERRADYLAYHDDITSLPNRTAVRQKFDGWLDPQQPATLLLIDTQALKRINDSMGHVAGDQFLRTVSARLRELVPATTRLAHLGNGEFLALITPSGGAAEDLPERILRGLRDPFVLEQQRIHIHPGIGICHYPVDGENMERLLQHADLAVIEARNRSHLPIVHYEAQMSAGAQRRLELDAELRHALERGEFEMFYQPRVRVDDGRIIGAEALIRWQHPERGLVGPRHFIPYAEASGLIESIGLWALAEAMRQQRRLRQRHPDLLLSVNLSARQLQDPQLIKAVAALCADHEDADPVELEITESLLMEDAVGATQLLHQLRAMGFRLAIDDFGTGYSNLGYLQRYPLTALKIDQSFIQLIDSGTSAITDLIIALGRLLNLHLIAEGIETSEQLRWIRARGVREYQGFLCSPPVPITQFEALLAAQRPPPPV